MTAPESQIPAPHTPVRWIGTSWKMNKTLGEARTYAAGLAKALDEEPQLSRSVQPFVIPPHTAIAAVTEALGDQANADGGVLVGAQNAHWESAGAWTGEISVPQTADAGARVVEIGHSERREHFNETVETTRLKVAATLEHGLIALLCVGESAEVRDAGQTTEHILAQAAGALQGLSAEQLGQVLLAYEPIWAIGEHGRPAAPDELAEPFAALQREYGSHAAGILYGGSVTQDNATELLDIPGVDGLFIGRAAWQLEGYLQLLRLAARHGPPDEGSQV